jgi:hypothetical protein
LDIFERRVELKPASAGYAARLRRAWSLDILSGCSGAEKQRFVREADE